MKAIEFKTQITDNTILIPRKIQNELTVFDNRQIRVILLYDENENEDKKNYTQLTQNQFLKGLAESDSIYDTYKKRR